MSCRSHCTSQLRCRINIGDTHLFQENKVNRRPSYIEGNACGLKGLRGASELRLRRNSWMMEELETPSRCRGVAVQVDRLRFLCLIIADTHHCASHRRCRINITDRHIFQEIKKNCHMSDGMTETLDGMIHRHGWLRSVRQRVGRSGKADFYHCSINATTLRSRTTSGFDLQSERSSSIGKVDSAERKKIRSQLAVQDRRSCAKARRDFGVGGTENDSCLRTNFTGQHPRQSNPLESLRESSRNKMTMDVSKSEPSKNGTVQQECAGCGKTITERYLLKALDMYWHEDCLKCGCCDCRLGEVGSTLYTKANLILCKRDYLRLFGNTGYCAACSKVIPAFEMVMRARANVYHLECFACQQCNHRFCVGDRFYLCENKILCEYDYEERLVFANMALHPPPTATLAHIKRQVTHLQPQSVQQGGGQRQANGESAHNHNGYPPAASSSSHNALNPMNNLNGINAQATYDAK